MYDSDKQTEMKRRQNLPELEEELARSEKILKKYNFKSMKIIAPPNYQGKASTIQHRQNNVAKNSIFKFFREISHTAAIDKAGITFVGRMNEGRYS